MIATDAARPLASTAFLRVACIYLSLFLFNPVRDESPIDRPAVPWGVSLKTASPPPSSVLAVCKRPALPQSARMSPADLLASEEHIYQVRSKAPGPEGR